MRLYHKNRAFTDVTDAGYVHTHYDNPYHKAGFQMLVTRVPTVALRHLFAYRSRGADGRRSPFAHLHVMDDFGNLVHVRTVDLETAGV